MSAKPRLSAPTECPYCKAADQIDYIRLGAPMSCRNCLRDSIARVPEGTSYPITEWHMQYGDFLQLIGDDAYRTTIEPLLVRWFGYALRGTKGETLIVNGANEAIDPLWLHLRIQDDAEKQYQLYQTAMSLWR
ncbi:MAG TPA: hypothetical protein VND45_11115 [Thermoanaerobaculia bacterium]|jgi:hypothetical protein|nr:hypothetical protein [Thermoanaerobaculia bacterium]